MKAIAALCGVSELLGIKKKLFNIRENVRGAIRKRKETVNP